MHPLLVKQKHQSMLKFSYAIWHRHVDFNLIVLRNILYFSIIFATHISADVFNKYLIFYLIKLCLHQYCYIILIKYVIRKSTF